MATRVLVRIFNVLNKEIIKVMKTRRQIIDEYLTIEKKGGVYKWYMTQEGADLLSIPTEGTTEKDGYKLVYIGLSSNMRMRLKWHCLDIHLPSSIKAGTLSILRQKINTLLTGRWYDKEQVDQFIDEHMRVEFEYSEDYKELELIEIRSNKCPLNARNNPYFNEFRRELSKKNGQAKRDSVKYLEEQGLIHIFKR